MYMCASECLYVCVLCESSVFAWFVHVVCLLLCVCKYYCLFVCKFVCDLARVFVLCVCVV